MIMNLIIGIFLGFTLRGIYNKYFASKWETAAFREIELSCLNLLVMTHEDYNYLKRKKRQMKREKMPKNAAKREKSKENVTKE